MPNFLKYFKSFESLFFPQNCCGCGKLLFSNEKHICTNCLYNLPKTNFHLFPNNIIDQKFWGKVAIERATAFYFFQKSLRIQKILHHLKYRNNGEVGCFLGIITGTDLHGSVFENIDCIISVPLHKKRQKLRGYNQSDKIAEGLSKAMNKPFYKDALLRCVNTSSQTRKNRFERWKNTENIFQTSLTVNLNQLHVLLVDDVITTGSTLESCALALKNEFDCKVSIFALAVAT